MYSNWVTHDWLCDRSVVPKLSEVNLHELAATLGAFDFLLRCALRFPFRQNRTEFTTERRAGDDSALLHHREMLRSLRWCKTNSLWAQLN